MDAKSPNHWSYAFVWRLRDPARLDDAALAAELTTYFRGLLAAGDGDKHRFDPAQISVRVEHGAIAAHGGGSFWLAAARAASSRGRSRSARAA